MELINVRLDAFVKMNLQLIRNYRLLANLTTLSRINELLIDAIEHVVLLEKKRCIAATGVKSYSFAEKETLLTGNTFPYIHQFTFFLLEW